MRAEELLFLGMKRDDRKEDEVEEDEHDIFKFLSRRHVDEHEPKSQKLKVEVNNTFSYKKIKYNNFINLFFIYKGKKIVIKNRTINKWKGILISLKWFEKSSLK